MKKDMLYYNNLNTDFYLNCHLVNILFKIQLTRK